MSLCQIFFIKNMLQNLTYYEEVLLEPSVKSDSQNSLVEVQRYLLLNATFLLFQVT